MSETVVFKLNEMRNVMSETEGKVDSVSKWARRGVIAEAHSNISYLKRRLNSLYAEFPLPKVKIADAEKYVNLLNQIVKD